MQSDDLLLTMCMQAYLEIGRLRLLKITFAPKQDPAAYLLHERLLYTSKNGSWRRARDYMADRVHTDLVQHLAQAGARVMPFEVPVTVDRDWFLLLPLTALQQATCDNGIYMVMLGSVDEVEQVLGAMGDECRKQLDPGRVSYVLQKKARAPFQHE